MAHAYTRVRIGWGLVDYEYVEATTPQYGPTQYAYAGASAAAGIGTGVRRITLHFDRSTAVPADDDLNCHFDFMNITDGEPDDSWIPADFAAVEALIATWFTSVKEVFAPNERLYRYAWHRVGPGVVKPNPAERILDLTTPVPGTGTNSAVPQISTTITLRTGIRRSWGRTYLPYHGTVTTTGRCSSGTADLLVAATKTLYDGAKSADFLMGVLSVPNSSFLGLEAIESDTTLDVIRRRRWKHTVYKKITPVT